MPQRSVLGSRRLCTLAALLLLVGGCGQKGPLFVPDAPASAPPLPTQTGSAEPNREEQDDRPRAATGSGHEP